MSYILLISVETRMFKAFLESKEAFGIQMGLGLNMGFKVTVVKENFWLFKTMFVVHKDKVLNKLTLNFQLL